MCVCVIHSIYHSHSLFLFLFCVLYSKVILASDKKLWAKFKMPENANYGTDTPGYLLLRFSPFLPISPKNVYG